MSHSVTLPLWAALVVLALALWAALDRIFIPSVRWFFRRRVNRMLEELNTRLHLRIQPFKLTKRQVLIDRLQYDPMVQEAAEAFAREQQMPRSVAMERVRRYSREIVPAFNAYLYFRVGYSVARRVARMLYRVRLGTSDDAALAAIPADATVVFVINHRSNMDYVLVAYLVAEKAALSYAVGEWARVWPLQTLIRSMGAYFVRRNSRDALYRRVLERYVAMATSAGVTQALFPEGGLSRDGRLQRPRLGLLDYMLKAFDPSGSRDLVFVPVGVNYDRTFEDRTLLRGLSDAPPRGRAAALRTAAAFASRNLALMIRNRWHRFGYACVNFGAPISLKAYTARAQVAFRDLPRDEQFRRVGEFADELMNALGCVIPVLPVSLVATVFVQEPEREFGELDIKARVSELAAQLESRGANVYVPRKDRDYAIAVGLRALTLRHLVDEREGLFRARPAELPLLSYYANSIRHFFVQGGGGAASAEGRDLAR
ncbi:MAG: 1-acyl-sn-glycerol-3-phosphate acyltransferase [Thermoanaerobaculia bacterium]